MLVSTTTYSTTNVAVTCLPTAYPIKGKHENRFILMTEREPENIYLWSDMFNSVSLDAVNTFLSFFILKSTSIFFFNDKISKVL